MMDIEKQPESRGGNIFCGAKTRDGSACINSPEPGKSRCRLHGGATGAGAPIGNKNAEKHGLYSREMKELRRSIKKFLKHSTHITWR
jgi:hypothetical protein